MDLGRNVVLITIFQLPEIEPEDVKKITDLDRKQLSGLPLDKKGTMIGWSLERWGWDHLKPARGPVPAGKTEKIRP